MRSLLFCWVLSLATCVVQASSDFTLDSLAERQTATAAYWYSLVQHNGISPTINNGANWTVFRNVKDFGAKGDGVTDDSAAIRSAIVMGNAEGDRASGVFGMTQQPAVVYFPPGTYMVSSGIQNLVDTVLMGDPTNRPIMKASNTFNDTTLLIGRDPRIGGLGAFQFEIKNLVLDSTNLATRPLNLLVRGGNSLELVFRDPY